MSKHISPSSAKRNIYFDTHDDVRLIAFMAEQKQESYGLSELRNMFRPSWGYGNSVPRYIYGSDSLPYISAALEKDWVIKVNQRYALTPTGKEHFEKEVKPALGEHLPGNQTRLVLENVTNNALGNLIRENKNIPEVVACLRKLGLSVEDPDNQPER